MYESQRRERDSNPRALSDKRFSRPPRYDRFDISPSCFCSSPSTGDLYILSLYHLCVNIFFQKIRSNKNVNIKIDIFHVFIVLPFCTIRSLFYCIFSLLGNAVVRLPLLPASHAPCIRCYASCFTSSLNNSPAE